MVDKILRHSVSDFLRVVTGPVDETVRSRVHFRDYIRWAFLIRMFEELKVDSTATSYSYLEISLAADFARSTLALEEGFTSEEWEDYARARFARANSSTVNDSSAVDYFSSWTKAVGEKLASILQGDSLASDLMEGELLFAWQDFENELTSMSDKR